MFFFSLAVLLLRRFFYKFRLCAIFSLSRFWSFFFYTFNPVVQRNCVFAAISTLKFTFEFLGRDLFDSFGLPQKRDNYLYRSSSSSPHPGRFTHAYTRRQRRRRRRDATLTTFVYAAERKKIRLPTITITLNFHKREVPLVCLLCHLPFEAHYKRNFSFFLRRAE